MRYRPTQATKTRWKMLVIFPVLVPMAIMSNMFRRTAHRMAGVGVRLCDWAQR